MLWDKVSVVYDLFEKLYNPTVYGELGERIAAYVKDTDTVLECACGTGNITQYIAPKCGKIISTDFSEGMLKRAERKLSGFSNIGFEKADITALRFKNDFFDVVVAGNVIHLLDEPQTAVKELERVCRHGGSIIIPTYIHRNEGEKRLSVRLLELLGIKFKRSFDIEGYKKFFKAMGCDNADFFVVKGRMPCAIAVIHKK